MTSFWRQQRAAAAAHRALHLSDQLEVRLLDGNLAEWAAVGGGEVSTTFEATGDGTGTYEMVLPPDHPVAQPLVELDEDQALIVVAQTASYRWCGFDAGQVRGLVSEDGVETVRHQAVELVQLLDDVPLLRDHARPLDAQPDSAPPRHGRAVTLAKQLLAEAVGRQWQGWPVRVLPPVGEDTSEPVTVIPDTQSALSALTDALSPTGCQLRAWVWLPGDPLPPGCEDLTATTVLFDVVDTAAFAGWSGDPVGGLDQYQRVVSGGGFYPQPVWELVDASERGPDHRVVWHTDLDGVTGVQFLTCPARGARVMWSGLRQGWLREVIGQDATGAAAAAVLHHAGRLSETFAARVTATTFVTGATLVEDDVSPSTIAFVRGKENEVPTTFEPFKNLAVEEDRAFDAAGLADGIADVAPPAQTTANPPTVWDEVADTPRLAKLGAVWRGAQAVASGANAEDMIGALWSRRGHRYLRVDVANGEPWLFGVDFTIGSAQGYFLPLAGRTWVDRLTRARFARAAGEASSWELTVGDGGFADPPSVRVIRALRKTAQAFAQSARDTSAAAATGEV